MKRIAHEWEALTGKRCEGLAATQIGIPLRIVILRKSNEMIPSKPGVPASLLEDSPEQFRQTVEQHQVYTEFMRTRGLSYDPWFVMINPVIRQRSGLFDSTEQCLSVPNVTAKVHRAQVVLFTFMLPNGKPSGLQVAQNRLDEAGRVVDMSGVTVEHECDHLDGRTIEQTAHEVILDTVFGAAL